MTENTENSSREDQSALMAAIDLGSNSFHMVVARLIQGEVRVVSKMGEKVQLGAGLDANNNLTEDAQTRALECLSRFAQKLQNIPPQSVRVVGTNTLRAAKNARQFQLAARRMLGVPIEVIAGREEARLVYLGVAHTLSDDVGKRLVIDIGGGSTEFIIGERFEAQALESLHMGCVSFSRRYFPDDRFKESDFSKAVNAAASEILYIKEQFTRYGWQEAVGSSGTFKSIAQVLERNGISQNGITRQALQDLRKRVLKLGSIAKLDTLGVKKDRQSTFMGGLAIVTACFNVMGIDEMHVSDGALREGVLYDLLGRICHEDVRERSIQALAERYSIDQSHAAAVEHNALHSLAQVAQSWDLTAPYYQNLLQWAARLHEIGLAISHTQYHKHGAYLLEHSDLPGFSKPVQAALALLVRSHRRKFLPEIFAALNSEEAEPLIRLSVLLRLAVLLQHGRSSEATDQYRLQVDGSQLSLTFDAEWAEQHPLTMGDLEKEQDYLAKMGVSLTIQVS